MTPVIVATEQEGVARVYYRESDGALTQTAQVLVGPVNPAELATAAADLAERFGWTKVLRGRREPTPELPAAEAAPKVKKERKRRHPRRTAEEIIELQKRVLAEIRMAPRTVPELCSIVVGDNSHYAANTIRATLDRISGLVTRTGEGGTGDPYRYSANGAPDGS